jgi:hypothetical protein
VFGIDESLLTRIIGAAFVLLWLAARLSLWKRWFWRSPRSVYPYLPIGLVFLVYPEYERAQAAGGTEATVYLAILIALGLIAIWWMIRPPAFVKPDWVRWIQKHPESTYTAMRDLVNEGAEWRDQITDQRAVDRWARRVGRKRK